MNPEFDHLDQDLWVFGYGSLIWRPGFDHLERVPAHIIGLHRSLCIYSFDHRGTPEKPGWCSVWFRRRLPRHRRVAASTGPSRSEVCGSASRPCGLIARWCG